MKHRTFNLILSSRPQIAHTWLKKWPKTTTRVKISTWDSNRSPISTQRLNSFPKIWFIRCRYETYTAFPRKKLEIEQAKFLWKELPIRFTRSYIELQNLPFGLSESVAVKSVSSWYKNILLALFSFPEPKTEALEKSYANMLASLLLEHAQVPHALGLGIKELKTNHRLSLVEQHRIDQILNSFFLMRISLRFLVEQYISSKQNRNGFRGLIQTQCSPVLVAQNAAHDVAHLCNRHLQYFPDIQVYGSKNDVFTAIPTHLYHILTELLKNSCRATILHHKLTSNIGSGVSPPIKVIVAGGREDITIKVMDEGGGIKRSDLQHVWSYMFSSTPKPELSLKEPFPFDHISQFKEGECGHSFSLWGHGIGLPLIRLYARYFGGSLKLRPMEGYGTDAYVHLHRLKSSSKELFPDNLGKTIQQMGFDGRMCTGKIPWMKKLADTSKRPNFKC